MIDVHCHLNDQKYVGEVDKIVENFLSAGVSKVICASSDFSACALAKQIAKNYDCVYYTVGIHPDECENFEINRLETFLQANDKKLVAVGEIGLDYHEFTDENGNLVVKDKEKQKQVFIAQIELANKYHLPVVIHCRDAYGDCLQILRANMPKFGFEFHCYSGSLEYARELIKLGGKLSFTGNVTFKNAKNIQEVASNLPDDAIMFETDSPYMAPTPFRGQLNEPAHVKDVLNFVADLRGVPAQKLEKISDNTAKHFFKI